MPCPEPFDFNVIVDFGPNLEAVFHPASELSSAPESPRAALHARGLAGSPARSPAEFRRSEATQHLGINQLLQESVVCGLFYHIFLISFKSPRVSE